MHVEDAWELYYEGERAYGRGDLDTTLDTWQRLYEEFFERNDAASIESKRGTIPQLMLVRNVAIISQSAKRWPLMRRFAERAVVLERSASNLQLLATALKNDGEPGLARETIEEAVRTDPNHANSHHEHACILAAEGELDAALQAMAAAIAAGAKPQSLLDDDELAMMRDVPGFARVMGLERQPPSDDLDFD